MKVNFSLWLLLQQPKKKKRLIRHICQGYPHHGTGSSPAEEKSTDYNRMSQNL